ncbi:hypothetical protein GCM10027299_03110 [Larkinella ripae]
MKKVLLSAYACLPNHGSEEGNGWNYAVLLSREGYEIHCFTQEKWKSRIELALAAGSYPNLVFHYVGMPDWLEKRYYSLIGLYVHYLYWQWKAADLARQLDQTLSFDLVHHVTYSSIQLGSFMYKVGKPFIFGPVGGGQTAPKVLKSYFGRYWSREKIRNWVSLFLQHTNPGYFHTLKVADRVLISNADTLPLARHLRPDKPINYVLDAGLSASFMPSTPIERKPGKTLKLLWVGRMLPRKALELSIHAFSKVNPDLPIILTIVGGEGEMSNQVNQYIQHYNAGDRVQWVGGVSYQEVKQYYKQSDLFFFTSLRDSCPMQIMEAMAYSLPVVTLKLHGQNELVTKERGIKIPVMTQEQVLKDLAKAVEWMYFHPEERILMGRKAYEFAQSQVWEHKIRQYVDEIYPSLLSWDPVTS